MDLSVPMPFPPEHILPSGLGAAYRLAAAHPAADQIGHRRMHGKALFVPEQVSSHTSLDKPLAVSGGEVQFVCVSQTHNEWLALRSEQGAAFEAV